MKFESRSKQSVLPILGICLLGTIANTVSAWAGPSSTGTGGGSVDLDGSIVEMDAKDPSYLHKLPGFDQAFKNLSQLVPGFAGDALSKIQKKTIYFTKSALHVPDRVSKLYLDYNKTPCYQTNDEFVCNPSAFNKMNPLQQMNFFKHEAVIAEMIDPAVTDAAPGNGMGAAYPSIKDTRNVVIQLLRSNITGQEASQALFDGRFGYWYNQNDLRDINSVQSSRAVFEIDALSACNISQQEIQDPNVLLGDGDVDKSDKTTPVELKLTQDLMSALQRTGYCDRESVYDNLSLHGGDYYPACTQVATGIMRQWANEDILAAGLRYPPTPNSGNFEAWSAWTRQAGDVICSSLGSKYGMESKSTSQRYRKNGYLPSGSNALPSAKDGSAGSAY